MGIEVYNFGNNLFNKMKQITVLSLILFLCYSGQNFAQEYIEAEYERITYSKNNSSRSTYFKLYASKDLSVSRLESIGKREESSWGTKEDGSLTYTASASKPPVRDDLYVNVNKGTIQMVSTIRGTTQQINDTPPSLNWHITDESKEIGGYIAIKAEVTFRGRDFEAWFTPEIPISAGPWKLHGLPGMILEVNDKEGQYSWYARNIKYPAEFDSEILVVNPDEIDEELSLQEALKQHLENQAREDRLRQARASQQGYKIKTMYSGRESWLERVYEWE